MWLAYIGVIDNARLLTGNSALAVYRSRDDPGSVVFVAGAYGAIVLLFDFLRRFERGEGDRGRTKAAVWLITTLLSPVLVVSLIATASCQLINLPWPMPFSSTPAWPS